MFPRPRLFSPVKLPACERALAFFLRLSTSVISVKIPLCLPLHYPLCRLACSRVGGAIVGILGVYRSQPQQVATPSQVFRLTEQTGSVLGMRPWKINLQQIGAALLFNKIWVPPAFPGLNAEPCSSDWECTTGVSVVRGEWLEMEKENCFYYIMKSNW